MVFKVIVHGLTLKETAIDLCDTEEQFKTITVEQLKEKIAPRLGVKFWDHTAYTPDNFRLIFTDQFLEGDSSLLCDYGIQHMSVIHVVICVPGGGVVPEKGDGGMGDKDRSDSMERIHGI